MKPALESVRITNLRSIRSETFPLSDFTALVGGNNTGKTSILLGLAWLFQGTPLNRFHFRNVNKTVEVEGTVGGLERETLEEFGMGALVPYLNDGKILIRRRQEKTDTRIKPPLVFLHPGSKHSEDHWKVDLAAENALRELMPSPLIISALPDDTGPFGEEEGNLTSQLLSAVVGPLIERYREAFEKAFEALSPLFGDDYDRPQELRNFDRELNRALEAIFPSLRLQIQFPRPDLSTLLRQASLRVYEEGYPDGQDLSLMGQGAQRAVQMALLRRLAETKAAQSKHPGRRLLLIEEPELHLHPQAVELVRLSLKRLSQEGYQVVFATHSAQMVTAEDVRTCLLIRKNIARGTFMRERIEDAVKRVVHDAPSQLQLLFSLSNSNEMLFADRIALTEGKTELRILPRLYERLTGDSFVLRKLALIRQGGVSNTAKSMKVLTAMDLPVKALVDLDYAFTDAVRDGFLEEDDPDLLDCMREFGERAMMKNIRLVQGIPVSKRSGMSASEAYAYFASLQECREPIANLHEKLKAKNIWLWTRGTIENHLGLGGKNEHVWSQFVERLGDRSQDPKQFIPDYEGVLEMLQWLVV
ncbi:MAG: AAA family ATPase [Fibrobacterales bacterium]|nr:AAA family ATPase [Fibrobacterales bacterium]